MQKDIRGFFGGKPSKPAAKPKQEPIEAEPASKIKSSAKAEGACGSQPSASAKSPTVAARPAKTPPSKGKGKAKESLAPSSSRKKAASKPAAKRRKSAALESDSEGNVDLLDSDFEIGLSSEEESSDDDAGFVVEEVDLIKEEEGKGEEEAPAAKKCRSRAQKSTTPAAKSASGGASSPAKPPSSKRKKLGTPKGPLAVIANDQAAMAAVAAVDEAAKELPPEEALGITFLSEAAWNNRPPDDPPHWGEREPPRGHPDCLTGKTFVVSGVLDSLKRPEAEDLVKRHGGKVTGNVSGRTSFLVVGIHTGRTKYQTAKQREIPIINEEGLFKLIAAAPAPPAMEEAEAAAVETVTPAAAGAAGGAVKPAPSAAAPLGSAGFYGASTSAAARAPPPDNGQLWVDKWRPKAAGELIGNQTTVATLRQWLKEWEHVHLHRGQPSAPPGAGKKDRSAEMRKKAALMSGSPGVGKTSSALIVARELGYEPVEVNASDTRSKADAQVVKGVGGKLSNAVKELSTNRAVSTDARGHPRKLCLIMDEVDGMSAGDRGGVADLIKTIAKSKIPIICICNDKYSQKLKSLKNHCLDLDFRKPTVQQISKRMLEICAREGLAVNQATIDALVQSANGGDIRLILGQLQMIRLRAKSLTYDQVRSGAHATAKDLEMSPFEAARRLLDAEASSLSLADQIELVFQDADLVPLLVQENYLNHRPKVSRNEAQRLSCLAKAAECFSAGDVANRAVRQYQNWALMPFAAAMGTVFPAAFARGGREVFGLYPNEPNFPRFTAWLGANSTAGKQRRLLGELHTRMLSSGAVECDRTALRLSYLPVLRTALTRPLVTRGKDGIPEVLALMRDYCIAREDIDFITDVTKFKTKGSWGDDPFKAVETAVKSAFTRAFNAQHLKPRMGFGMEEGKKKGGGGRKGAGGGAEEVADGLEEEEAGGEGEEEEEEAQDPLAVQQKLAKLKHSGVELTLKDGSKARATKGARGGRGGGARAAGGSRGGGRGRGKK